MSEGREDSVRWWLTHRPRALAELAIYAMRAANRTGDEFQLSDLDHVAGLATWRDDGGPGKASAMAQRRKWAKTYVRLALGIRAGRVRAERSKQAMAEAALALPHPIKGGESGADMRAWFDWAWSSWWRETLTGNKGQKWEEEEKKPSAYWKKEYGVDTRAHYLCQRAPWLVDGMKAGGKEDEVTQLREALKSAMWTQLKGKCVPEKSGKKSGRRKAKSR